MHRKLTWRVLGLLGATATVVAGLVLARPAQSADHRDAPKTTAEPSADINDVYTWIDGNNLVMAMTVFPFADSTARFSNTVQYVFHTTSGTKFGETVSSSNIICTFDATQIASCWVGTADYVTGNASAQTGITSASGKTQVFAGLRADPFFFNLSAFNDTTTKVEAAAGALTFDTSGCPLVPPATVTLLQNSLKETATTTNPGRTVTDDFATASTLALVVSVDKSLVTQGGVIVSVWGSTNRQ
jgi:hypothetical protein